MADEGHQPQSEAETSKSPPQGDEQGDQPPAADDPSNTELTAETEQANTEQTADPEQQQEEGEASPQRSRGDAAKGGSTSATEGEEGGVGEDRGPTPTEEAETETETETETREADAVVGDGEEAPEGDGEIEKQSGEGEEAEDAGAQEEAPEGDEKGEEPENPPEESTEESGQQEEETEPVREDDEPAEKTAEEGTAEQDQEAAAVEQPAGDEAGEAGEDKVRDANEEPQVDEEKTESDEKNKDGLADPEVEPEGPAAEEQPANQEGEATPTQAALPVEGEGDEARETRLGPTPENSGKDLEQEEEPAPETPEEEISPNPLNLVWSFGVNKNVPAQNVSSKGRNLALYTCAHIAILYDWKNNSQTLLQGHCNDIVCTCISDDKRWIATADKGTNSTVIVWDSYTGMPVQTLFDAHPEGIVAMSLTPDAKYLVTISASANQVLAIWDWTTEGQAPICSVELKESYGQQKYVIFNPENITQIVSNSEHQVIFYSWGGGKIEYFAPPLGYNNFNRTVGNFSQSLFVSNSNWAYTATSVGNVVVWDNIRPASGPPNTKPSIKKKAFKLVRLQDKSITVLTTTDRYVVTGDVSGHVKFYDWNLRMSNWYSDFNVGPINSISFEHIPEFLPEAAPGTEYPPDTTIQAKPFVTLDYVVGTSTAHVAHIIADGARVLSIQREHDAALNAVATHPHEPFLCIGSYSGYLKIWNYKTRKVITSREFPKGNLIRSVAYDPKGTYLAVGFTNGSVRILDSISLEDECPEPFRFARGSITHCAFSHNSIYLATADADYCVSVYKAQPENLEQPWAYVGKQRAHYKPIRNILFNIYLDTLKPRLLSLGEDRALVEYDLENSSMDDLRLVRTDRIEQSAIPQCMAWYPPITKENFLLTANDQFKFKLYNASTKMCRKTMLGPTYGSPLQKIEVLPTKDPYNDKRYMAYITEDKVGLHILPLDGNPHNAIALIAHPGKVTNLVSSFDGNYIFTSGGLDFSVHMWKVNTIALEAASQLGGEDLIPFYGLLEGGREGELFAELENYFYYAQLRSQGVDTMNRREVAVTIPLSEIPFVTRALGFYPSEQEVEDMLNEIKYSEYVETGKYVAEIDLGTFIKLFVNHRPAFGLSTAQLQKAFDVLGIDYDGSGEPAVDRSELLELLQTRGEHLTEVELAEYLTTLLGFNPEGGSSELGAYDASNAAEFIEEALPENITAEIFSSEVLAFGYAEVPQVSEQPQILEINTES